MNDDLAGLLHDADLSKLGQRIRNARLTEGLTQAAVAGDDVTISYVSRIEAGQRRPDLALLQSFADRLNRSALELLTGESEQSDVAYEASQIMVEFALETGDAAGALALARELLVSGPRPPAARYELETRYFLARALESTGDYEGAIEELEQVCRAGGGTRWVSALIALSRCYRETGDFARAIDVGDDVKARLIELGLEGSDEAIQLEVTVTFAHFARGDLTHAIRLAQQTIRRADESGSPVARASAYWNASVYEQQRGAPAAAIPLARQALQLLARGGDARNLARLRAQVGQMLLKLDPPELAEAEEHLQRARQDLQASSASATDIARCNLDIAELRLAAGDLDVAHRLASQSREAAAGKVPLLEANALTLLGQIASQQGNTERATDLYASAVAVLTGVGADRAAAQSWLELGALLEEVGEHTAATNAYRSAAVSTGLQIPGSLRRVTG